MDVLLYIFLSLSLSQKRNDKTSLIGKQDLLSNFLDNIRQARRIKGDPLKDPTNLTRSKKRSDLVCNARTCYITPSRLVISIGRNRICHAADVSGVPFFLSLSLSLSLSSNQTCENRYLRVPLDSDKITMIFVIHITSASCFRSRENYRDGSIRGQNPFLSRYE